MNDNHSPSYGYHNECIPIIPGGVVGGGGGHLHKSVLPNRVHQSLN